MARSTVRYLYESMILRAYCWRFSEFDTVRISAAGQTLGACTCNFTLGMHPSAVRTSAHSTCTQLGAVGRSDQNGTGADSKRWLGKQRDETADAPFRVCPLQKVLCPQRGGVSIPRPSPWPELRAFNLVLCRQRTRWQLVRG